MAGTTLNNQVDTIEVGLAIEQILIGDYPAAWTAARVDVDSPPSGFFNLGAVVEDTPSIRIARTKFQLDTGVPSVRQFEAIQAMEGTLEASMHSFSWRVYQYMMGNYTAVASCTTLSCSISSINAQNVITLGVSPSAAMAVGDQIVIATAGQEDTLNVIETKVSSINGLTLAFDPTPLTTPATTQNVYAYTQLDQVLGSSLLKHYTILAVADFTGGQQVVHHFAKCAPGDEIVEEIRPGQNPRLPLSFDIWGLKETVLGTEQLVLGHRHYFPATS